MLSVFSRSGGLGLAEQANLRHDGYWIGRGGGGCFEVAVTAEAPANSSEAVVQLLDSDGSAVVCGPPPAQFTPRMFLVAFRERKTLDR